MTEIWKWQGNEDENYWCVKKKKTTEKTVWENCTPRSEINLHVETFLNVFSVSLYVCIVCMYAYAICTFRSSMVRLWFPNMTKPIEFVCKARPFGIIYSILGTAEESSLWRCGHSWVPDKLLLLLLLFWLLSKQPAAKVWHFSGIAPGSSATNWLSRLLLPPPWPGFFVLLCWSGDDGEQCFEFASNGFWWDYSTASRTASVIPPWLMHAGSRRRLRRTDRRTD